MDAVLSKDHGTTVLLAGLIIVLCFHLLLGIGKFIYQIFHKKSESADRSVENLTIALRTTTDGLNEIRTRMTVLERDLNEVLKFRQDFRRLFAAVKMLADDKWPEIRKKIIDEDFPQ